MTLPLGNHSGLRHQQPGEWRHQIEAELKVFGETGAGLRAEWSMGGDVEQESGNDDSRLEGADDDSAMDGTHWP